MSKEKFLESLEKKLKILNDSEKEDIINEYRDIIEEKIKHGKTEEEAVKEFGNINKLAEEILSAYKINPDYNSNNKSGNFVNECENLIKTGAKKLSDVTDEVVDGFKKSNIELNAETIFEIIIKIILILLGLAILKIPFYFVSEVGSGIFGIGIYPFSRITSSIWKILVEFIYIVVCLLVIIVFIKKYTNNKDTNVINYENNKQGKSKNINNNQTKQENIKNKAKKKQTDDALGTLLLLISKLFIIFVILIPLWMIIIFLLLVLSFIIYLIFMKIGVYGFLLLLLGILGIFITISSVIYNLMFNNKKVHLWPILVNFILIIVGTMLSFNYIINLEYIDNIPNDTKKNIIKYEEVIDKKTYIPNDYELIVDNNLENNKVVIEVEYCRDYGNIEKHISNEEGNNYISINNIYNGDFENFKKTNKLFFDNLKHNKVYNYSLLYEYKIKVYTNEVTKELID